MIELDKLVPADELGMLQGDEHTSPLPCQALGKDSAQEEHRVSLRPLGKTPSDVTVTHLTQNK